MQIPVTFRPILKPISFLLHDHRFVVAVLASIAYVLSTSVPQLAGQQQSILTALLVVVTFLVTGYSLDSITAIAKGAPTSLQAAEQQAITTGLADALAFATGTVPLVDATGAPITVPAATVPAVPGTIATTVAPATVPSTTEAMG
jgi:hypothetical protein